MFFTYQRDLFRFSEFGNKVLQVPIAVLKLMVSADDYQLHGFGFAFGLAFARRTVAMLRSIFRFSDWSRAIVCSGVSISAFGTARMALANRLKRSLWDAPKVSGNGAIIFWRGMTTFSVDRNSGPVNV